MVSIIVLWVLVLFETGLLLLLLRTLGQLRQQGGFSAPLPSSHGGGLDVGEQAPSFVARDDTGHEIRLDDYQGQRRILAFVSPGCPACAGTIQTLNAALKERQEWVVLVVGGLDHERNRAYAAEHNAQMPILTPTFGVEEQLYRVRGVPTVFVIDEGGVVRAKGAVNESKHLQVLLATTTPSLLASR